MNNLSDAEIIKALECCSEKECTQCPAFDDDIECGEAVIRLAINLINRLKAENDYLNRKFDESMDIATNFEAELNERDAEEKKLKAEINKWRNSYAIARKEVKRYQSCRYEIAKSKAVKEFAKFIIDKIDSGLITHSMDIPDCVVEFLEMTENEGKE